MFLLVGIRAGLWMLPFRTVRRLLAGASEAPPRLRNDGSFSRAKLVWAVEAAGRCVPPARTCLTQALAAQVLFARRGYPALLHIGVCGGGEGRLEAHAWLKSGDEVVMGSGPGLERYTPLTTLEAGER